MRENIEISPSILSADFMDFGDEVRMLEDAGADWVHIDVMDGHFVPNITMGVPLVSQMRGATDLLLDVHLMITNPITQIPWFLDAGADIVTFHIEACEDIDEVKEAIVLIKDAGAKAAVAIKPKTEASALDPFLQYLDMALVMSVEPGFSGQSYIEGSEEKVRYLHDCASRLGLDLVIQVDGGIGESTISRVVEAGATSVVCGNAVFKSDDPTSAIASLRSKATLALESWAD